MRRYADSIATNRWIDPPERPDEQTVEQLRAACREEPRIAEAWLTGSLFTRADGSSTESIAIALVLDPPAADTPGEIAATTEMIAKLDLAWPTAHRRSWLCVSRGLVARHQKHCVALYGRD